ncbi:MAG: hypothetical protein EOM00_15805, partial [Clostridia bacterium]|nr:hypothetical protein [Clostridia bacterium]
SFSFERFTGGINHLICLGKGNLKDRLVIHLYVQEDGTIGNNKFYTGEDERTSVYDYSSCESAEELQEKGIERLKELMSYTNMDMDLYNQSLSGLKGMPEDVAIGDIVGGRDKDTGIYLSKQITQKIVAVKSGRESINYKVGGNTLNRSTATAPAEPTDAYQEQIDTINTSLSTHNAFNGGTYGTLKLFLEGCAEKQGYTFYGKFKDSTGWTPTVGWWICFGTMQDYDASGGVNARLLLMQYASHKIYVGQIGGAVASPMVIWDELCVSGSTDRAVNSLGTTNGITFRYYKKGNVVTVTADGNLTSDINGWSYIYSPQVIPVEIRPLLVVSATWSTLNNHFKLFVGVDGKVGIQNCYDTARGINLNIPLSVCYGANW